MRGGCDSYTSLNTLTCLHLWSRHATPHPHSSNRTARLAFCCCDCCYSCFAHLFFFSRGRKKWCLRLKSRTCRFFPRGRIECGLPPTQRVFCEMQYCLSMKNYIPLSLFPSPSMHGSLCFSVFRPSVKPVFPPLLYFFFFFFRNNLVFDVANTIHECACRFISVLAVHSLDTNVNGKIRCCVLHFGLTLLSPLPLQYQTNPRRSASQRRKMGSLGYQAFSTSA